MRFLPKHVNPRGDTIVEVLIALAIVSSVLAGAFLVTQKSTLAVRDGQEHGELSQVLQGQVELVRSLALTETSDTTGVFRTSPKYFCIDTSNPAAPVRVDFLGSVTALPSVAVDDYSSYPSKCQNLQTRYNIAITYDNSSKIFIFTGRWDGIAGNKNEEQFVYRIYPGAAPVVPTAVVIPPTSLDAAAQKPPSSGTACRVLKSWSDLSCWNAHLTNTSNNPAGVLVSCTWDWGDGTVITYPASHAYCQNGNDAWHQYAIVGSDPTQQIYYVTVTNKSNTGVLKTSSPPITVFVPF